MCPASTFNIGEIFLKHKLEHFITFSLCSCNSINYSASKETRAKPVWLIFVQLKIFAIFYTTEERSLIRRSRIKILPGAGAA
jgi:hypothetical protein